MNITIKTMMDERAELNYRIIKLYSLIYSEDPTFESYDEEEQSRAVLQLTAMEEYEQLLGIRLQYINGLQELE